MVDSLAFLPLEDVSDGMNFLKNNTPEGMEPFVTYFDQTTILLLRALRRGALIVFKLRTRPVCGRPVRLSSVPIQCGTGQCGRPVG
ncbi:hypothetical protein Pcinc_020956 [Petrolisthes cinctipes]|uniref:Uncharacterized protein n=1 Tax=Petrolisthes cinctipes TaxID=88211 RepID=A0AAE1KJ53_PETCI|nr:hypothetical protein Pcinc_020956 [Petrolisthes cinctipes]